LVFCPKEEPQGFHFEVIYSSISGILDGDFSLTLQDGNKPSFPHTFWLAVKRAPAESPSNYIRGVPFIDDLCLIIESKSEEVPEKYKVTNRPAHRGSSSSYEYVQSHAVRICWHQRPAIGICDLQYESATLDRYPLLDAPGIELPVNELPMFAFPHDLSLKWRKKDSFPLPDFYTFVFTDAKGDHMYCACLRFFEKVDDRDINLTFASIYGSDHALKLDPDKDIFCPKVICVVTRTPFYRAMRRFLRQLYSLSLSKMQCPIEFFIAAVIAQIPAPIEGGRPFHLQLDAALISPSQRAMARIVFQVPILSPSKLFVI